MLLSYLFNPQYLRALSIIASHLQVTYGCDTSAWSVGINNCTWSLLHRAIYELDEDTACFLIRNGREINRYYYTIHFLACVLSYCMS